MKALRITIIAFIVLTISVFFYFTIGKNPEVLLFESIEQIEQHLVTIILLLIFLTLLSTVSGLPVFYFGMAIGFLMPLLPALVITWTSNLLSVMATFYMVRFSFYKYVKERFGKKKMINRINKHIKNFGIWSVVFSRAVYIIPTNIINFSFPLSKINIRTYLFGTAIGLLPEIFINVFTGYLIRHEIILLSSPESQTWKVIMITGFLLLFAMFFTFFKIRQKRKKEFKRLNAILPIES